MTGVATPAAYYERLRELTAVPFWQLPEFLEPAGPEQPHVWSWHDVFPELDRSRHIVEASATTLQRRALILRNPGLAAPALGATHTLAAAYQMLLPGESAPVHAHSMSALRFGLTGSGAKMIVDGQRVPMNPGDLVLTPGWCWHGHQHLAGHEPAVWLDGLDVPFVFGLRAGFYREGQDDRDADDPAPVRDTTGISAAVAFSAADESAGRHSPIRRYPWEDAYGGLRRLLARADGHNPVAALAYRNPITGGPALATIACYLYGLGPGARSQPMRETASSVFAVARGSGILVAGGQDFELQPHDVGAIPAWTWHQLIARDSELVLFLMSDRPIHDAFGLYRAETAYANDTATAGCM